VFRLYPLLTADMRPNIPGSVHKDMTKFLDMMGFETIDFKAMGLRADLPKVLDEMKKIYGI
jgi:maleate cis-trans isomerase